MRKFVNTVLAGALGLSMIAGVSAQTVSDDAVINVGVNKTDGTVSPVIIQAPTFEDVEYSLNLEGVTASSVADGDLIVRVTDNRGGTSGWVILISGENFEGEVTGAEIDATNLTLGTGSPAAPDFGIQGNVNPVQGHTITNSAQSFITATNNAGSNGIFTITYSGSTMNVPGGTPVDNYTSTLTVSIPAAPDVD